MSSPKTCRNCGNEVFDGDMICVVCGTNLLTGRKPSEKNKRIPSVPFWKVLGFLMVLVIVMLVVFVPVYMDTKPIKLDEKLLQSQLDNFHTHYTGWEVRLRVEEEDYKGAMYKIVLYNPSTKEYDFFETRNEVIFLDLKDEEDERKPIGN